MRVEVVWRHGLGRFLTSTGGDIVSQGVGAIVRVDIIEDQRGTIKAGGQVVQMTVPWHGNNEESINLIIDTL